MKNLNWKHWTAIGILLAVVITCFIIHLVQPQVSYAWLEVCSIGTFILGFIAGYLVKRKHDVNS